MVASSPTDSSISSSSAVSTHSNGSDTNILESQPTNVNNNNNNNTLLSSNLISGLGLKKLNSTNIIKSNLKHLDTNTTNLINEKERMCCSKGGCCTRKCACNFLISVYLAFDIVLNAFFVTHAFTQLPDFKQYNVVTSVVDTWIISLLRDLFLIVIVTLSSIRHRLVHRFVKWIHQKYLTSVLCLAMYAFAMIKMLLHSDQRVADKNNMFMFVWNIGASFCFFIALYMLALLKPKQCNYHKTDVDGGDLGDQVGEEEDIFIGMFK